ncbi:MAG: DUF2256 and DUF3253 domain-containing protein [Myxococcota bacterium]
MSTPESKICDACGRTIEWRKKWARSWNEVRYCSSECRRRKVRPVDQALESAIIDLLNARSAGVTICPSEAARQVAKDEDWRELMEPARRAARRLVAADKIDITQKGRVVDPSTARGPIRLRLR